MKFRWISVMLALALVAAVFVVLPAPRVLAATTYYSQGSLAPDLTSSWNSNRGGGGSTPANFASGDVFVIQNGHNMTTSANWAVSGTGAKVQIESGGSLTAGNAVSVPGFQIDNGGSYIHNFAGLLPGSTRAFGATSTIEFRSNSTNTCPVAANYGNLIINISTYSSNVGCGGNLASIAGNLEVRNTSGFELRFVSTQSTAHTIGGDLSITGGTLVVSSGTGSPTVGVAGNLVVSTGTFNLGSSSGTPTLNVGGNFSQTGGTFTSSGSGISTVVFTGGSSSSVTFSTSGGTFTNTNINWQIASGKTVANNTNFGSGSWVNASRTMTVNGTFQINQGSWTGSSGAWSYGSGAALVFNNSSGLYGPIDNTHVYWPNGVPHVILANTGGVQLNATRTIGKLTADANTSLEIGNGDFTLVVSGELLVNAGKTLTLVGHSSSQNLYVYGAVHIQPGATLNNGQIRFQIMGNWLNEGGTYNSNGRGLLFGGSSTQTISSTSGTETFECPAIDKTGGSLILASAPATNVTFSSCGTSVWSFSQGTLDLNGRVLTLTGSGTDVLLGIGTLAVTGGAGSRVVMNTNKVFYSYNSPALYFDTNVTVEISAGMNFGISGLVTIRGTLLIKPGGYVVAGRAPRYGPASTLKYDTPGSTYVASEEWYPNTTSGPGVPQNVEVTAGTTLSFGAASTPRTALGNVTIDGALVLSTSIGGDLNVGGNWVNNGAFNANNRAVTFNGSGAQAIGGATVSSFFDIFMEALSSVTGPSGGTINVAHNWTNDGAFNANGGAVHFNGSGAQAIGGASVSSFFDIFLETFSSVTGPSGGTINVAHNWTNDGAFNANGGTVVFNGSTGQTIGGNAATAFNNLSITNAAGVTLNQAAAVDNSLVLNTGRLTLGSYNLTLVSGATIGGTPGSNSFVVADSTGFLKKTSGGSLNFTFPVGDSAGNYTPVMLNCSTLSSGSSVDVRLTASAHPQMAGSDYIKRYWTLQSTAGSVSCTGVFSYASGDVMGTESLIRPVKWDGTWHALASGSVDTVAHSITGGFMSFSDFTGGNPVPLAVTLASLNAAAQGDAIQVAWETVSELGNAGFNLYRDTSPAGPGMKLNAGLIPSQGPNSPSGFSYSYLDNANLAPGTTYTYWLEDVSLGGVATRHEPVSATYAGPTAVALADFGGASTALPAALPLAAAGLAALGGLALARRRR